MASSGVLRRVALVRTDILEELSTFFIRLTRIGELGTMLAVTSNRRSVREVRQALERTLDSTKYLCYALPHTLERDNRDITQVTALRCIIPVLPVAGHETLVL
jgi:hypothetical protein